LGDSPRDLVTAACLNLHIFCATSERICAPSVDGPPASIKKKAHPMNSIIYIVGLIVIVMAILSFIGLA
jgi:hypothetical protein